MITSINSPIINGSTSLVGLIGWPIEHSLSPVMHNAAFRSLGLNWRYLPLPVQPGQLDDALRGLTALNFTGCNVTVPYKEEAFSLMDHLDDGAHLLKAINTIQVKDGKLIGTNTDPAGFLTSLGEAGIDAQGMDAAVLGAGGASRAVIYALSMAGVNSVLVANRTVGRGDRLVEDMAHLFPLRALNSQPIVEETFKCIHSEVDLVINTTPLGMGPQVHETPWPDDVEMSNQAIYYDLVYNPEETAFLARARAAGAKVVGGLGMLIHQGALSFQLWTGLPAPIEIMRQTCEEYLSNPGKIGHE